VGDSGAGPEPSPQLWARGNGGPPRPLGQGEGVASQTEPSPLLTVEGVSAGYGQISVLTNVSLHVLPAEVVAIIGPNGAGKSTVLKTVMGFLRPSGGRISFAGTSIAGHRPDSLFAWG
jgi:ABC-type sugar transport system ATPase subunit